MQDIQSPISKECPVCGRVFEPDAVGSTCPDDNSLLLIRADHPLLGKTIADRYRLVELVGEGGWSVVFRAEHVSIRREYAIKVLHPYLANDGDNLRRFQQEAEAASRLNHPNIASVYDYGLLPSGQPYLVMDFLHGQSLAAILENCGKLGWDRASKIFIQACNALESAHEKGLIHRDIKPANIMIVDTADGDLVKVCDFGLAKLIADSKDASLTATGHTMGTPSYMSPEQCMGQQMDARTDIYSLGCVMYETLSGVNPFKANTYLESMNLHLSKTPQSLTQSVSRGDIPLRAAILIGKALSKQEEHRQQSMAEMRRDIEAAGMELSSHAALIVKLQHAIHQSLGRLSPRAVSIAAALCTLILFGAVAYWQWSISFKPPTGAPRRPSQPVLDPSINVNDFMSTEYGKRLTLQPNRPALAQLQSVKDPETYMAISLASTQFSDKDLPALLRFRNVREVDLTFTSVTDKGLPIFKQFPNLGKLALHGCDKITDASIDTFYELPMLRRLNLSLTSVTEAGVKRLSGLKQLRKIHLKALDIGDEAVGALVPLRELELLDVERTHVTDKSMKTIAGFRGMLLLNIRRTQVTDAGLAELTDLPILTVLNLAGAPITDDAAKSLKRMPHLRDLEINDTNIDDKGFLQIAAIPTLTYLSVTGTQITPAAVEEVRRKFPHIKINYLDPNAVKPQAPVKQDPQTEKP